MTEGEFWQITEKCFLSRSLVEGVTQYEAMLDSSSQNHIIEFQEALNVVMTRAYTWDLIGAACFLGCGQSDDGFEDFRSWLITRGSAAFRDTVSDPNVIASFSYDQSPTEEWYCEEMHLMPGQFGGEEENENWPYRRDPDRPFGQEVELTQAALKAKFPLLWERFGNQFMIGIR